MTHPPDRGTGQDAPETPETDLGALEGRILARPRETWEALGIGATKGHELLAAGELQSIKEGKARRVVVASVRDYLLRRIAAALHGPPAPSPTRAAVAARVARLRARRSTSDTGAEAGR